MTKQKLQHRGQVKEGKFVPYPECQDIWNFDIESLEGFHVSVEIEPKKYKRSIPQNRYYWGVVVKAIKNEFNKQNTFGRLVSEDATHDFLARRFIGEETYDFAGQSITRHQETKKLSPDEFNKYFGMCIAFGSEYLGIEIPLPNEK